MQIKEKAEVFTAGGEKVGEVDRVVVDPRSFEVTHLVVKKGILLTRDKVIPLDGVASAGSDRIELNEGIGSTDDLPDFEETHHVPVADVTAFKQHRPEYERPMIWYGPAGGVPWRGKAAYPGYPNPAFVKRTDRNIPEGTIPLEEGAKVMGKDGKYVGEIERIYTEPEEKRAVLILISKGTLSKEKKLVPTHWVDRVHEDSVHLSVESDLIRHLPDHEAE